MFPKKKRIIKDKIILIKGKIGRKQNVISYFF